MKRFENFNTGTLYAIDPIRASYLQEDELVIAVDTSVARTVALPDFGTFTNISMKFFINDVTGNAATNNITIIPSGAGQLINGAASVTISTAYGSLLVTGGNGSNRWIAIGGTGGGGGAPVISVTVAQMQVLIGLAGVVFPATYIITDLADAGAVFLSTSVNSINSQGVAYFYIPDYTIVGAYKGQLLTTDVVNIGERWIWGNLIWESTTGVNSAPIDAWTLDPTDWVLVAKSTANNYLLQEFIIEWDVLANKITFAKQASEQNSRSLSALIGTLLSKDALYGNQWSNGSLALLSCAPIHVTNNTLNNKITSGGFILGNSCQVSENDISNNGAISNNAGLAGGGKITGNVVDGAGSSIEANNSAENSDISGNTITDGGKILDILAKDSEVNNNTITGDSNNDIGFAIQNDACSISNNSLTGIGCKIESAQQNNNSEIKGNIFSGNGNLISGVSQLMMDKLNNITITSNNNNITSINQLGNSEISGFVIGKDGIGINWITINGSNAYAQLAGFTYTVGGGATVGISNVSIKNSILQNGTDIDIQQSNFEDITIDFSGWSRNINGLSIINGKGTFTFTHDFTTSPLTSGSSVFYNFLPSGAVITKSVSIVSGLAGGVGATLRAGLETDDVSYCFAATTISTLTNQIVNALSNIATGQRSIELTAGVDDITAGTLQVQVEFII